ncbi:MULTISPECIES: S41 family peptidase [Streptacidiphilus]|uniref:Tricorn protease homolog n=1 Tax=Streptacidiphilus cavernicola TaxID=3342716 RepID=A0ABV6UXL6_9ACTN|nr:S41 family peptidase [Streptacidiphilus jeojiense]
MTFADGYFRYPHIHGDAVTFVAEDDVWVAPFGGRAWRVSADQVPVSRPRFSPDGSLLAWTSTADGAPEVHVAPVEGGPARRLTYWGSAQTAVLGWTPEGEPLALSSVGQMSRAHPWAFAVPLDGGPARRLPYGRLAGLALEPGGSRALLSTANGGREPAHWKRYRGGRAGKLWLGTDGAFQRVHQGLDGNIDSPMWVGGRIAFLSDHDGVGRLWSSLPDGSDLRVHSEQDEFYARNASTDGSRVVFQRAGALWLVDSLDGLDGAGPRRIEFDLGGPSTARRRRPVAAADHLGTVSPDAEGRSSLVEVRGTVHRVTHQDGPARVLADAPGVRNRLPQPLPDGASVWVTDAEGEDGLDFSDGRRVAVGALGRVEELVASPDGAVLAVADRDGRVLLVTVADGEVRELDRSEAVQATGLVFSPDSAWLAWSHGADLNERLRQIRLARLADGAVTEVTPVRFNDHSPAFSADGRHLAFLSIREFDPVYDEHVFDLSFPVACRPYLALLTADTLSPFDPLPQGRRPGKPEEEAAADAAAIRVDTEGIAARVVPFPVEAGRYEALRAVRGGFSWLHRPLTGMLGNAKATPDTPAKRTSLEYFDLAARRLDTLAEAVDRYAVSGDGTRLTLVDGKKLRVVPADRKAAEDDRVESVTVDLDRIRITLDPPAEWRQMVAEAARLMRDNYWRVDLGGVDWEAVQQRYRPLVDRLGSHDDLVDLLWEIQGELGTSHAYVQPRAREVADARRLGLLGADLARSEDGDRNWRIVRILPGESSDPAARSPLAAPGLGIRAGDAVLAVNGRTVDPVTGPAPLLAGTAGKPVELTLGTAEGGEYSVVVVPLADEEPLRYHDWVAGRRARVRELSGGRLGYLHLPDQMSPGWAQLHRDLHTESSQAGLIVDTRENRGGHTSQLVVEKLRRRVVKWQTIRGFRPHPRYPEDAPRGPLVAVADEFSGSDGDNINAAFQAYGLGPVVGVRTWGGVVGIDGHYRLVDGTGVTQPRFRTWFEGYDWGLENHGVDPDVEVVCTPEDWAAGRDPQLDEAVRIALRALETTPAVTPPGLPPL